jgi:putative oxidoreductase
VASKDKSSEIGILILRIGLGLVLLYHGSQKVFGLFGGMGFQPTLETWEQVRGVPQWLGFLAIASEFGGGLLVMLGLLTRAFGFLIACTMATAAYFEFSKPGASEAIWQGRNAMVATYGYPIVLAMMGLALVFLGSGRFSLDQRFFGRRGK